MHTVFDATLVNGPFGDPGVYAAAGNDRRALLFDVGELAGLTPKQMLRVSDVFVSHTHMDHFVGFDTLLRLGIGNRGGMRLFGPAPFVQQVGHKLAAYTWNLVENYPHDYVVEACELDADGGVRRARYRCHARFARESLDEVRAEDGVIVDETDFRVRAAILDHSIGSVGYAVEEKPRASVNDAALAALGLAPGAWLKSLKQHALGGSADDTPVAVGTGELRPLGSLKERVLTLTPGRRFCYVTDVVYHEENARRIAELAREADPLFIECVFLDADRDHAARKKHLTARQAGTIAHRARAKSVVPFHFSPRYGERGDELRAELTAAWRGERLEGA